MSDNASDKFVQSLFCFLWYQRLPSFNRKNDLDVNLRIGVSHEHKMKTDQDFAKRKNIGQIAVPTKVDADYRADRDALDRV